MWDVIAGCGRQLRAGMGAPYGLDFGAALALGQARGVDMDLLAQALPHVEGILLDQMSTDDGN
ncbi:MAG: hypothetical protein C0494_16915 [Sphingobium sp.]|nr:hypothetical protein [Sphingobium sp.]